MQSDHIPYEPFQKVFKRSRVDRVHRVHPIEMVVNEEAFVLGHHVSEHSKYHGKPTATKSMRPRGRSVFAMSRHRFVIRK